MTSLRLEDLAWPEVAQAIKTGNHTIIIMVGSTEQHGPHLPLSTDSLIADKIGLEVARSLGNALVAPTIRVGASKYHLDFPGTISLTETVLRDLLIDYCRSLAKHGFSIIIILPTHSGNCGAIKEAVSELRREINDVCVIGFTHLMGYFEPLFQTASKFGLSARIAGPHAGEAETSMILAIRPEQVNMDRATAGYIGDIEPVRSVVVEKGTKFVSENGIFGDPTLATASHGEAYLSSLVNCFVNFIQIEMGKWLHNIPLTTKPAAGDIADV